jgi:hypothetical protein
MRFVWMKWRPKNVRKVRRVSILVKLQVPPGSVSHLKTFIFVILLPYIFPDLHNSRTFHCTRVYITKWRLRCFHCKRTFLQWLSVKWEMTDFCQLKLLCFLRSAIRFHLFRRLYHGLLGHVMCGSKNSKMIEKPSFCIHRVEEHNWWFICMSTVNLPRFYFSWDQNFNLNPSLYKIHNHFQNNQENNNNNILVGIIIIKRHSVAIRC